MDGALTKRIAQLEQDKREIKSFLEKRRENFEFIRITDIYDKLK